MIKNYPLSRRYWKNACKKTGKQPKDYLNVARGRFVVLIDGTMPELWPEDGTPRIYDSITSALAECLSTDTVMTEYEFIRQYC